MMEVADVNMLARGAKRLVKDGALGWELPRRYQRAVARSAVNPRKALFVNGKLESVPDAFSLMMPHMRARGFDVEFIGLGQKTGGYRLYNERCLALMDLLAEARFVFLEDASDVVSCVDLRPETKVVQLWHACGAFKKWGMSTAELKFGGTAQSIQRHPFYRNLSIVTVSSPEVEWAYREAMMLEDAPGVVQALGVSRTDVFFDEGFARASREWLEAAFPHVKGRKVVLYAPTFRSRVSTAAGPDQLDIAAMRRALGDEWTLVVKHHPFVASPPAVPDGCEDFAALAGAGDPTDALLACADALVTDYSSVVFEYSLLGRPMAFFAYDRDDYDDWRGFYYPYEEMTPGPVVTTTGELIDYLVHLDERFEAAEVAAFRERFMSACDGNATARIADAALALG